MPWLPLTSKADKAPAAALIIHPALTAHQGLPSKATKSKKGKTEMSEQFKRYATIRNLRFLLSLVMFIWLCWYFYTGFGGPSELVAALVPVAVAVQILCMHENGFIYKKLPPVANHTLVVIYLGICLFAFYHFVSQYEEIAIWRQGSYTRTDFIMGLLVFLLVMELSRVIHTDLFWVNVIMVVYTMFGNLSPIDFFWHPGTTFYRVITSSTVELSTGIYGQYAQIALTTIGAFLLLAAAARRLRRPGRDGPVHAADRRQVARHDPADGRAGLVRGRHDQRQRGGQCDGGRRLHHPADEEVRHTGGIRRERSNARRPWAGSSCRRSWRSRAS